MTFPGHPVIPLLSFWRSYLKTLKNASLLPSINHTSSVLCVLIASFLHDTAKYTTHLTYISYKVSHQQFSWNDITTCRPEILPNFTSIETVKTRDMKTWSRFFFPVRLTQPLAKQCRGWKQSYPDFLAADCEQIHCGLPHEGCCIRLRSSAPPEGIQGNSSHSRKRKQCGPLGWQQRKIHQGPNCGVGVGGR